MEEQNSPISGVAGERNAARARLSDYLRRETGASSADADRRADEILMLVGSGAGLWVLPSLSALASNWWLFMLRGVLALIFGVLTIIQPVAALAALVLVFGVWAFIDGINSLALALSGWRSWQLVLGGLVGIAVGLFTFFRPGITAIGLFAAVAAWSIARGILEIVVAIELRKRMKGELWLVLGGIASILFGVLMIALPAAGVLALAWLIAVYALTFGVIMLALSFRLRRVARVEREVRPPMGAPTIQPA